MASGRWLQCPEGGGRVPENFEASALPWNDKLRKWARELDTAVRGGKNFPDKPKFISKSAIRPEDRFFLEVSNSKDGKEKHTAPFALTKEERDSILTEEPQERVSLLRKELEELKKASPPAPPMACAVVEGEMVDQKVFIRGAHSNPGE